MTSKTIWFINNSKEMTKTSWTVKGIKEMEITKDRRSSIKLFFRMYLLNEREGMIIKQPNSLKCLEETLYRVGLCHGMLHFLFRGIIFRHLICTLGVFFFFLLLSGADLFIQFSYYKQAICLAGKCLALTVISGSLAMPMVITWYIV